jgi:hypothetical protein
LAESRGFKPNRAYLRGAFHGWRNAYHGRGRSPGDREEAVLRRYPNAEQRRRTWWPTTSISIGDRREFPVVEPTIDTAGQVRANRGWIGAAGD